MIETKIEDLIASIDKNTAALIALAAGPISNPAPAKQPKQPTKPKTEPKPEIKDEPQPTNLEPQVEKAIESMLKANKRKEAIELLASFNGAKSKTGIIEQGAEVMAAFLEGAESVLLGA